MTNLKTARAKRLTANQLASAIFSTIFVLSMIGPLTGCASGDGRGDSTDLSDDGLDAEVSADSGTNGDLVNEELSDGSKNAAQVDADLDPASAGGDKDVNSAMKDSLNEPISTEVAATPPVGNDAAPGGSNSATSGPSATGSGAEFSTTAREVNVTDIRYLSKQGGGTVVIDTSEPATYRTREVPSQNQVVIEIANARLPDRLKRPFVTKDFKQSIEAITAYQDKGSNTARVVLQFKQPSRAAVAQSGNSLTVIASESGGPEESSSAILAQDGAGQRSGLTAADAARSGSDADGARLPEAGAVEGNPDDMKFYGRPISLEFSETPIKEVITMIAEQSGANIMLSSDVSGTISLKLKQVPWDQALLLVMKSQNLGYVRQGNVLRIAPLKSLEAEIKSVHDSAEAMKDAEPLKIKVVPISYAKVGDLAGQVKLFLSKRGNAKEDTRTSSIILTDIPENLQRAANLIKALDTPPMQVLIEGKVVEARENFSRNFGINWGYSGQATGSGQVQFSHDVAVTPGLPTGQFGHLNLNLGTLDIFGDINAALGIAESEDLARIISAPRIMTMNNEAANITQKTQIPIPTSTTGAAGVTTGYKYTDITLSLDVTPQITSDSDVIMQVNLTREFPATSDATPAIESRSAKTKVLVRNGQTAVIGGIYQADTQETEKGLPYLRDIPILGWLFKQSSRGMQKNELLLFLTPRIMTPEKVMAKEGSTL